MHPVAARRILRLALGTALSLWFSQVAGWPLSFVAPVLVLTILALPMPVPGLKAGIGFVIALLAPVTVGLGLVPVLQHARWSGIILLGLALYFSFYYTARGGSAVMGTFMTIGLTLVVTIGSVNGSLLLLLVQALALNAVIAIVFVWIAHAALPDLESVRPTRKKSSEPSPIPPAAEARRRAFRSLLIVLPLTLVFLFVSGSPAYTAVMIKVAAMGQEANAAGSRAMARSLLSSTFWGGVAAIVAWNLMSIWPSLTLYTLLAGIAALLFGRRIFRAVAVFPDFSTWSYALLTMVVLLAPAVLDTPFSQSADSAFWTRLFLFVVVALYGSAATAAFDVFWPARGTGRTA